MSGLRSCLVRSQFSLYLAILICVLMAPTSLADNSGLSYFGVHGKTVLIYGAGLLTAAYYLLQARDRLASFAQTSWTGRGLQAMALLIVGIVLTPYSLGAWFDWVHTALGTCLFSLQLIASIWFVYKRRSDWLNWWLLATELASGIAAFIYLAPSRGLLMQSQIVFQLSFSGLLFRNLALLKPDSALRRAAR